MSPDFPDYQFRHARWFTRGWCLQELIAPSKVEFFAQDWSDMGTKWSLRHVIFDITGIPERALLDRDIQKYSIAERMSWASTRETTRIEDMAYCLLGLFDINMPLLYGEGKKAFLRLQREILSQEEDFSIFLWTATEKWIWKSDGRSLSSCAVLAPGPSHFHRSGIALPQAERCGYRDMKRVHDGVPSAWRTRKPLTLNSRGLQIETLVGPDAQRPDHLLLLWTGYAVYYQYICVELESRVNEDGTLTMDRSNARRVVLVDSNQLGTFSMETLHLTINRRVHSSDLLYTLEYARNAGDDFGVVLSSVCQTYIDLVDSQPHIPLLATAPLEPASDGLPFCLRLYCQDVSDFHRGTPLESQMHSLKFVRHGRAPGGEVQIDYFQVGVWLRGPRANTRCCVFPLNGPSAGTGESGTLGDGISAFKGLLAPREIDELSDRASCQLPQSRSVITVAIKRNGQLLKSPVRKLQWPAVFMLYIKDVGKPWG